MQRLQIKPEHVSGVAKSQEFVDEVRAVIEENFTGYSLLAFASVVMLQLNEAQPVNRTELKDVMRQHLSSAGYDSTIPEKTLSMAVTLLTRATAVAQLDTPEQSLCEYIPACPKSRSSRRIHS